MEIPLWKIKIKKYLQKVAGRQRQNVVGVGASFERKQLILPRILAFAGRQVGYFFSTEKVTKASEEASRQKNAKSKSKSKLQSI